MKTKLSFFFFVFATFVFATPCTYCQTSNPPKLNVLKSSESSIDTTVQTSNPPKLNALKSATYNHPGGYLWGGCSFANYCHIGGMLAGQTIGIESNFFGTTPHGGNSYNAASLGLDYRIMPSENFFAYAAINYTTEEGGTIFPTIGVNLHLFDTTGFDIIIKVGKAISKRGTDLGLQLSFAF